MAFPDDLSFELRDLNINQYVYHYTRQEIALTNILSSKTIRLGPLSKTNDPRETKSWTFGLIPEHGDLPSDPVKRKQEVERLMSLFDAANAIRANCKVFCVTMDDPAYDPGEFHEFKRGFGHSRMWAQYGESHKGCCIIFHKNQLHEAIFKELNHRSTLYFEPVEYSDQVVGAQIASEALSEKKLLGLVLTSFF
jgi:hypothetical protein